MEVRDPPPTLATPCHPDAAADDKAPKDAKAELDKLTGTWKCVSVVRDGKDIPKPEAEAVPPVALGEPLGDVTRGVLYRPHAPVADEADEARVVQDFEDERRVRLRHLAQVEPLRLDDVQV